MRPLPPESMFDIGGKAFEPAPEVAEWVEATFFDPSSPIANPDHEHLAQALLRFRQVISDPGILLHVAV